jgi:hypothetical protein
MANERRKQRDRRQLPNRRSGLELRATERRQRLGPTLVDQRDDDDRRQSTERRGGSDRRTWVERRRPPA